MPKTLRQHFEEAKTILSCLGGPTILPSASDVIVRRRQKKRWRRNPKPQAVRPDIAGRRRDYAISVKILCERLDRTGYAVEYLNASEEMAGAFWHSIPQHPVCPLCLGRAPAERPGKGKVFCVPCGTFIHPKTLRGLVARDLALMSIELGHGEIRVKAEKGERG